MPQLRISYTDLEWAKRNRVHVVVSRDLVELGQDVVEEVARECAGGARALQLQLRASRFYEALKREIRTAEASEAGSARTLAAAADQCRRAATCTAAPARVVNELRAAVAMLCGEPSTGRAPISARPQLRLIRGGRV